MKIEKVRNSATIMSPAGNARVGSIAGSSRLSALDIISDSITTFRYNLLLLGSLIRQLVQPVRQIP